MYVHVSHKHVCVWHVDIVATSTYLLPDVLSCSISPELAALIPMYLSSRNTHTHVCQCTDILLIKTTLSLRMS